MYERRTGFWLMYALLTVVAAAAVCAGLYKIAAQDTRTVTVTKPQPGLTASSSVKEAQARYAGQAQQIDGQQIGLPAGVVCDAYELADGLSLVCYQGGAS